jgi:hypothetical protein
VHHHSQAAARWSGHPGTLSQRRARYIVLPRAGWQRIEQMTRPQFGALLVASEAVNSVSIPARALLPSTAL